MSSLLTPNHPYCLPCLQWYPSDPCLMCGVQVRYTPGKDCSEINFSCSAMAVRGRAVRNSCQGDFLQVGQHFSAGNIIGDWGKIPEKISRYLGFMDKILMFVLSSTSKIILKNILGKKNPVSRPNILQVQNREDGQKDR